MEPTDEEVRVIALPLPREEYGWALTPGGKEALDAAERMRDGEPADGEPTMAIPRAGASRATGLARQRKSTPIDGDPPASL